MGPEQSDKPLVDQPDIAPQLESDLEPSTPATNPTPIDAPLPGLALSEDEQAVHPLPQDPKKTNKNVKKWLPAIIALVVVIVLAIGTGIAYALYQRPGNVVASAIVNALNSRSVSYNGSESYSASSGSLTLNSVGSADQSAFTSTQKIDGTFGSNKLTDLEASTTFLYKGELYVKISNLEKNLKAIAGSTSGADGYVTLVEPILQKVDNKNIKITDDSLKSISGSDSKFLQCSGQLLDTLRSDQSRLSDLYQKYPFIVIAKQLGDQSINGHDSFHYQLKYDDKAGKSFGDGFNQLSSVKQFYTCTGIKASSATDTTSTSSDQTPVDVWIDKWSHNLTRISSSDTSSGNKSVFTADLTWNNSTNITTPSPSTDLKDIWAALASSANDNSLQANPIPILR